ncbi:HYR-like domain-containing protein, partial [Draconibacterium mangrovi]|uniref:HYR-like domain-containing protein n=1 Tax=Draconibacterium mangrovi TaxID=2697469 RepID=UPI0013D33125
MKKILPKSILTRTLLLGLVFLFSGVFQGQAQDYPDLLPSNVCEPADSTVNCTANSANVVGAFIGTYEGIEFTDDNIGNYIDSTDAYIFISVVKTGNKYDLYAQFDLREYRTDGSDTTIFIQAHAPGNIETNVYRIYQPIPNYVINGEINSLVGLENMIVGWDNTDDNMPTCLEGNYSACNAQIEDIIAQGPFIVVPSFDPINCNGETTSVEFLVSGGTGPYSVTFNGSTVNTTSTFIFDNVGAGSYTWTATDSDGHSDGDTLTIGEPDAITASYSITTPISCSGGFATIDIDGDGGTGTLTYSVDGTPNTTGIFVVTAGNGQAYTIIDANGCLFEGTFDVTPGDGEAPEITGTLTTINDEGCSPADATPATNTLAYLTANGLTITDASGNENLIVTSSDSEPTGECPWTIIRTYTVADACGNETTAQQTITVDDTQAPAITGTLTVINDEGCSPADATPATNTLAYLTANGLTITDACG